MEKKRIKKVSIEICSDCNSTVNYEKLLKKIAQLLPEKIDKSKIFK